jgi:hypothetical protein
MTIKLLSSGTVRSTGLQFALILSKFMPRPSIVCRSISESMQLVYFPLWSSPRIRGSWYTSRVDLQRCHALFVFVDTIIRVPIEFYFIVLAAGTGPMFWVGDHTTKHKHDMNFVGGTLEMFQLMRCSPTADDWSRLPGYYLLYLCFTFQVLPRVA